MQKVSTEKYFEGSNFLKAKDLQKAETTATIDKFEEIKTRLGERPILRLRGFDFPLGLNSTNLQFLIEKYGDDADKWTGKKVILYKVKTTDPSQGGKEVDGIRIK